jgi:serine/threonine protein kinase
VIHRDIKPENLIFDEKGYLRLTDLGVARVHSPDNYKDTSGTPGYMAPEVINRENHSFPVDYFALGVIAYECMLGKVLQHLFSVPIEDIIARKYESRCYSLRLKSARIKFRQVGALKLAIL